MRNRKPVSLVALAVIASFTTRGDASEICGNGIDDDGNGMEDDGCYPTMTTGLCESPLSCGDTGMVSWSTGIVHYDLPPDVAPRVPYGPGIGMRRFYTSAPVTTKNTAVNAQPMGPGWGHTYLTFLRPTTVGATSFISLHTSQGRDVLFTASDVHGPYTAQKTDHYLSLTFDGTNYLLQLLTGETLKYNTSGQLIEVWDTLGPTPNKVLVTWDGTSNSNVSTVTDASGKRRLLFSYTNNLLTELDFQLNISGTWTTKHTTTYDYSNGVTRDATSGWYTPANATDWTNLLTGSGINNPDSLWLFQEASGNFADTIGTRTLTAHGTVTHSVAVTGWSRKGFKLAENANNAYVQNTAGPNPSTTSSLWLMLVSFNTVAPATKHTLQFIGSSVSESALTTGGKLEADDGANSVIGTNTMSSTVIPLIFKIDRSIPQQVVYSGAETLAPTWSAPTSSTTMSFGGVSSRSSDATVLYSGMWTGTNAQLPDATVATLISRLQHGPGVLSSVTIGGQLAQKMVYTNGLVAQITDGAGNNIVTFAYDSATTGRVVRVDTPRGTVGFEFNTSRTGCTAGNTVLYFNKGNTSSCNVDTDCGTGFMCGGKTGSGSTGTCFLAARCLTVSNLFGESVITNVSPLGPGGGSCSGACADVMLYTYASASNLTKVNGQEDALTNYTSVAYNSNGTPSQIGYGDTDNNPTNVGANRTIYLTYDTTFPGRIVEIDRQSDLHAGSCTPPSVTTGCEKTIFTYASDTHLLTAIEHDGYTFNSSGGIISGVLSKISQTFDTSTGRITEIDRLDGSSNILNKSVFDYYSSTDPLKDKFLQDYKVYKDATNFLMPQILAYDFWGHPTTLKAPDGNLTCDTYDTARGFLSSRRHAMGSEIDCSSFDASDITTSWARDSALRLSQLTRPDGSCVFYSYDSSGRAFQIKRRDDCNSSSSGDMQQFSYTADSQVSEIDTYDSSSTLVAKQPYTYFAGRQLQEIVNPVDTSKFTGLVYDAAGKVTEVDGAASLSKTVHHYDTTSGPGRDGRITSEERYKTSTTSDTWSLLYAWMGDQSQVTDGDSKTTTSTRDDASRLVQINSPDLGSIPTVHGFDAADRRTTVIEQSGGPSQRTHNFTFDEMNRPLADDYATSCAVTPPGVPHPEILRVYDALPIGVSCPMAAGCNNLAGRLAYVQTILYCSSAYQTSDGSLDQTTFYSYDKAGRLVEEYITDDTNRVADHLYQYTKNGALSQMITPSTAVMGWTFGSASSNSDTDRVTAIWRTSTATPIADTVQWFPFGPWKQYNWEASIGGTLLRNRVARNLAYRISTVFGAELQTGASNNAQVTITEDAMGRVTQRVFSPAVVGLQDSYFTYDLQSRVLCEASTSGTCPTIGATLKNNHNLSVPFTNAGDWKQILRPIAGSVGGVTNNFDTSGTNYGFTHQVGDVNQSDGTPAFGETFFSYTSFGERAFDDNPAALTNDRRDYTYDMRHNLINVRGQYFVGGGAWHFYDVASAFDAKNRRVYKSFFDETTGKTATWFFYYDAVDRLTEVRYTPDTTLPNNSVFQLFWLGTKLVLYWETDFPGPVTSKRYVTSDETGRPMQLWNWPATGDATRVWAINPSAWGVDTNILGPTVYQPMLFPGQYIDRESAAYENDGSTIHRQGVVLNKFRSYDAFLGGYLQLDPFVDETWSGYLYVNSNPVSSADPSGLMVSKGPGDPLPEPEPEGDPDPWPGGSIDDCDGEGRKSDGTCMTQCDRNPASCPTGGGGGGGDDGGGGWGFVGPNGGGFTGGGGGGGGGSVSGGGTWTINRRGLGMQSNMAWKLKQFCSYGVSITEGNTASKTITLGCSNSVPSEEDEQFDQCTLTCQACFSAEVLACRAVGNLPSNIGRALAKNGAVNPITGYDSNLCHVTVSGKLICGNDPIYVSTTADCDAILNGQNLSQCASFCEGNSGNALCLVPANM